MKIVQGSILDVKDGYILQQCNCITVFPHGLAASLAKAFPNTCPYYFRTPVSERLNVAEIKDRSEPGTVMILGSQPQIVNMFAQYSPGKVTPVNRIWWQLDSADGRDAYVNRVPDQTSDRERYFQNCLDALFDYFKETDEVVKIAVPYLIGCGLAGGNWNCYKTMLEDFEKKMLSEGIKLEMTIYQLA